MESFRRACLYLPTSLLSIYFLRTFCTLGVIKITFKFPFKTKGGYYQIRLKLKNIYLHWGTESFKLLTLLLTMYQLKHARLIKILNTNRLMLDSKYFATKTHSFAKATILLSILPFKFAHLKRTFDPSGPYVSATHHTRFISFCTLSKRLEPFLFLLLPLS